MAKLNHTHRKHAGCEEAAVQHVVLATICTQLGATSRLLHRIHHISDQVHSHAYCQHA
jgi:hypothetical protein